MNVVIIIAVALLMGSAREALAEVFVTTTQNGRVQIHWTPDTLARTTFKVFRRGYTDAEYPRQPLAQVAAASCRDIEEALQQDASLARLLRGALALGPRDSTMQDLTRKACEVISGDVTSQPYRLLARIAAGHWRLAKLMGSYFEDVTSLRSESYTYDVRYPLNMFSDQSITANSITLVVAGRPTPIAELRNVSAYAGDGEIQVTWSQPVGGAPCIVSLERSTSENGWQTAFVSEVLGASIDTSLTGVRMLTGTLSMIDAGGRDGLFPGRRYYYRIRQIGAAGQTGPYAPIVSAVPIDKTLPRTAEHVSAEELINDRKVVVRWGRVFYDVRGRRERMGSYRVYRMLTTRSTLDDATLIGEVRDGDVPASDAMVQFIDLQPTYDPCKTMPTAYRIVPVDSAGNIGMVSAPASFPLLDRVPPERAKEVQWQSTSETITLTWQANTDCNIHRYNIYRSLCDYGSWVPCAMDSNDATVMQYIETSSKSGAAGTVGRTARSTGEEATCGGPFVLVGYVDHRDGVSRYSFTDRTIPEGSPLCYAYVVSVEDSAGNQSVSMPLPDPVRDRVLCANLIDIVSPLPGHITGIVPAENAMTISAMTAPVQDLAGFYLYRRSDSAQPYVFMQARIYDVKSRSFITLDEKLPRQRDVPSICDVIPLGAFRDGMQVEFLDDSLVDKLPYWYKVIVVDRNGNESSLDSAVDVSSFTYGRRLQPRIRIQSIQQTPEGGALRIAIDTAGSYKTISGYAVYRSNTENGEYQQIDMTRSDPMITDASARRGRKYWYKAMVIFDDATYSDLSPGVEGILP